MWPCPSTAWSHPHSFFHYHLRPSILYLWVDSAFCSSLYVSVSLLYTLHPWNGTGEPCTWSLAFLSPNLQGTARAIQNLQNLFTAVPVANQRPPSLKSITCLPGDLPNSSSPWEATIVPSPPGSLPPVRPFFLPNVIPSEEPSFLLPVYQKPCQLSAAH